MKYYFVDYENVHADGCSGLEQVASGSQIYIVYSENCKNITLDILEKAGQAGAQLYAHKATTGGKNALDFQLSSLLGYIIGKNETKADEYIIVSKDTGYDGLVDFW